MINRGIYFLGYKIYVKKEKPRENKDTLDFFISFLEIKNISLFHIYFNRKFKLFAIRSLDIR